MAEWAIRRTQTFIYTYSATKCQCAFLPRRQVYQHWAVNFICFIYCNISLNCLAWLKQSKSSFVNCWMYRNFYRECWYYIYIYIYIVYRWLTCNLNSVDILAIPPDALISSALIWEIFALRLQIVPPNLHIICVLIYNMFYVFYVWYCFCEKTCFMFLQRFQPLWLSSYIISFLYTIYTLSTIIKRVHSPIWLSSSGIFVF